MCLIAFVAVDRPFAGLAPTDPPTFAVEVLTAQAATDWRLPFPAGWTVAILGAHSGCSCGFQGPPPWSDEAPDAENRASCDLLDRWLRHLAPARRQLFAFWWQQPAPDPVGRLTVPPSWFAQQNDPLPEDWLIIVDENAPMPIHPGMLGTTS